MLTKKDFSKEEYLQYEEGLCVQCMHIDSYDQEPITVDQMHMFMEEQGYRLDFNDKRLHHEIYLSDIRKVKNSDSPIKQFLVGKRETICQI